LKSEREMMKIVMPDKVIVVCSSPLTAKVRPSRARAFFKNELPERVTKRWALEAAEKHDRPLPDCPLLSPLLVTAISHPTKLVFRTASKFAGVVAIYMIPLVLVDRQEYEWLYRAIADELKRLRWVEDFDVILGKSVKYEIEGVAES
jgi:hypothetical protein